ncbi:MAG: cupin domain-containing protein [Chloroflexi bacterium]|nr:cupin domain-containing protein [Chloroflexota bacterium]
MTNERLPQKMASPRKGEKNPRLKGPSIATLENEEISVGRHLRSMRALRGLSMRALAEASGLNINTLSMIENNKTSPSVSTLQQLAATLKVPLTSFFEAEVPHRSVVFQKAGQRPRAGFSYGTMEDLGAGLTLRGGQPLIVVLESRANSGPTPIVHTGHEFVYCLDGQLTYIIEGQKYLLEPGDSLIFEAHLPHRWGNLSPSATRSLLIICPTDENDHPTERHFLS